MKCYKHEDKDAIGSCQYCGVGLCKDCFGFFTIPVCFKCNKEAVQSDIKNSKNTIIKYLAIGIICSLFVIFSIIGDRSFVLNLEGIIGIIIGIYFSIFIGFGWSYINSKKNPNTININENLLGLLIRKVFKLVISGFIGGIVGPYQLHQLKKDIKIKKEALDYIEANS